MQVRETYGGEMRMRARLSDHADWKGLCPPSRPQARAGICYPWLPGGISRYLNEQGIQAAEGKDEYGEDEEGGARSGG